MEVQVLSLAPFPPLRFPLMNSEPPIVVAALYHFTRLDDYVALREPLLEHCRANDVRGTLLLAAEGINGTIAGTRAGIDAVLAYLCADARLAALEHKESFADAPPFQRMKVKLKREIVTMGVPEIDPTERVGTYVDPAEWNDLIGDPDVLVIDTRNDYEVEIGTFDGAVDPHLHQFRDFPVYVREHLDPAKHRRVAMFCTGGIRCEKASAFMLREGFQEVYHLKGGILKYLETVPRETSRWNGDCFVFDERVAVGQALSPGSYTMCQNCGRAVEKGKACGVCSQGTLESLQ